MTRIKFAMQLVECSGNSVSPLGPDSTQNAAVCSSSIMHRDSEVSTPIVCFYCPTKEVLNITLSLLSISFLVVLIKTQYDTDT